MQNSTKHVLCATLQLPQGILQNETERMFLDVLGVIEILEVCNVAICLFRRITLEQSDL